MEKIQSTVGGFQDKKIMSILFIKLVNRYVIYEVINEKYISLCHSYKDCIY